MRTMEASTLKVVMLPWLAHGHISPFLELAKKLSKKNFTIFFCSTPINLTSIRPKLAEENYTAINLVEFSLPSLPELPPHYHTTNGLPNHLIPLLIQTFESSGSSILTKILEKIKPNLLIYDMFEPWVKSVTVLDSISIPAVHFQTGGIPVLAVSDHLNITNKFPEICYQESEKKWLKATDFMKRVIFEAFDESCEIVLVKSWQGMDGKYMDFISELCKKNVISVGPLSVQDSIYSTNDRDDDHDKQIFEWLNKKDELSTVFVSFGSESFLSKDEIEEVAHGLEGSNVNFLWVIRLPKGENVNKVEEILPEGFIQRVNERGKIVFGWAPQARILKHSSIGGFMSHCGWGSITESLRFGVPIIAMPLQYEQPLNARMVVELGVAMEVLRDEKGDIMREDIAKVIREVVVDEGGENVRKKAREVGEKTRIREDEDVDSLVDELQKLCHKYNTPSIPLN